mgnify:CR=1 FL=1
MIIGYLYGRSESTEQNETAAYTRQLMTAVKGILV